MSVRTRRISSKGRARRLGQVVKTVPIPARPFSQHQFEGKIEFLGGEGVPVVFMTREVYSRMWHFVDIADQEVSWLGTAEVTKYGNYLIEEVFLLEQEVAATETELSGDGQAKLAQHLIDSRPDGVEVVNKLRFWGHSHVRMQTSPSHQDEEQMKGFRENGCPWFIRGIMNKLGRMEFTIFLWEAGVKIVDAPWAIYEHVDGGIRAGIEAEFKNKVSRKVYVYTSPANVVHPFANNPAFQAGLAEGNMTGDWPWLSEHLFESTVLADAIAARRGIVIRPGGGVDIGRVHYDYRARPKDEDGGPGDDHVG